MTLQMDYAQIDLTQRQQYYMYVSKYVEELHANGNEFINILTVNGYYELHKLHLTKYIKDLYKLEEYMLGDITGGYTTYKEQIDYRISTITTSTIHSKRKELTKIRRVDYFREGSVDYDRMYKLYVISSNYMDNGDLDNMGYTFLLRDNNLMGFPKDSERCIYDYEGDNIILTLGVGRVQLRSYEYYGGKRIEHKVEFIRRSTRTTVRTLLVEVEEYLEGKNLYTSRVRGLIELLKNNLIIGS